jgi:signal transduction histidine kinase
VRAGRAGQGVAATWWQRPWSVPPVAVVTAVVQVVGTFAAAHGEHQRMSVAAVLMLLAAPAALLGRLRWPVATVLVTLVVTVAYYLIGFPYGPAFVSVAVAFLAAVAAGHRLVSWVVGWVSLAIYYLLFYLRQGRQMPSLPWLVGHAAGMAAILVLAEVLRMHRDRVVELRLSQVEQERRRNSEERLRIAQELHDVLAHNISLINVQAGVALHLIDQRPEQARTALAAIKQASKETLDEMRGALDVLRGGNGYAPLSPVAGLSRLPELTDRMAAAGLPVGTTVDGGPRELPIGVDLAAYRIIQEALTNVYRHAGATAAQVRIAYREDDLIVQVDDDGTGAAHPAVDLESGGNGIPGMRERAVALGGGLTAGPRPSGGFRVRARLPLDGGT